MRSTNGTIRSRLKAFFRKLWTNLPAPLQYMLAKGSVLVGAGIVPILLFEYSPRLGFWWIVLLIAYIGLLISLRVLVLWPREKNALINDLGHEQFYALFPRERIRDERRRKRRQKQEEKKALRRGRDLF